jgi:hypothetical protein
MNKLHAFALGTGSLLLATGLLFACSSEDTVVNVVDAGGPDATPDVVKADAEPQDSGPDTSFDGGVKLETFPEQLADAFCRSQSRCCFGDPNVDAGAAVDGGTYNRALCQSIAKQLGFETSSSGFSAARTTAVVIDQVKALDCVQKVDQLTCNTTGTELATVRSTCFNAFQGQMTQGQGCLASVECAKGLFCSATDGGMGACEPLRDAGAPCGDWTNDINKSEEACSWRGGGDPGRHCETFDLGTGQYTDAGLWTCQDNVANGQPCNSSVWCADGICDPTNNDYTCKSPLPYFGSCAGFITP